MRGDVALGGLPRDWAGAGQGMSTPRERYNSIWIWVGERVGRWGQMGASKFAIDIGPLLLSDKPRASHNLPPHGMAVVEWCSGAVVEWWSGAAVQRCSGAVVQWCSGAVVQ